MFTSIMRKVVGSKNDREVKRLGKIVKQINDLEPQFQALTDSQLKDKTAEYRERLANGESLQQLLPEAFATVREASVRIMGMRHFDVQLIGGMVLNDGKISEMKTGEGKTLVATLAAYLNALPGKGVHVVTVNDYLARRDAEWMRPLYEALGMTVGVVVSQQEPIEKKAAYQCDITYGTNNEFGFDYLRDNMAFSLEQKNQRGHAFAIVDEVDSILIDEARTPLIISGPAEDSSERYFAINKLIPDLVRGYEEVEGQPAVDGDFTIDEKQKSIELTEAGHEHVERLLIKAGLLGEGENLYEAQNLPLLHHLHAGLKAYHLFQRNVDYIIEDEQIVIVDEHTGRKMPGRRWSEGIHQAIEAKEGLNIQKENQTLASTTFQNYFRLYEKLSGMTGTADTEAFELNQIYGLDVVVIPTNRPVARIDSNDKIYMTEQEKYDAIIEQIKTCVANGQPVLVGTASVESSERISEALKKAKLKHNVLNAKNHANEASIIADAGKSGSVTIATNMAGRGTDIVLGGKLDADLADVDPSDVAAIEKIKAEWQERHDAVKAAGGLHIIGTERHESRRIDNQLRGRAGRQGDPGSSCFYLSLEDNLMRIFMSERMKNFMQNLGFDQGEPLEHKMVSNSIEKAQRRVENRNFDMRKQLLEYDDVNNDQRRVIYHQRDEIMMEEDLSAWISEIRAEVLELHIGQYIPPQTLREEWDVKGLVDSLKQEFALELDIQAWLDEDRQLHEEKVIARIIAAAEEIYKAKEETVGASSLRNFEKQVMLQILDQFWKEHLHQMDRLRMGIHLRGYAQKNPKQEYKREAFELFQMLLSNIKLDTIRVLSRVQVRSAEDAAEIERRRREQAAAQKMSFNHAQANALDEGEGSSEASKPQPIRTNKVGRNEPCPCGSGKKFKQCHGKLS